MRIPSAAEASRLIDPHRPVVSLRKRRYNTNDIITLTQEVLFTDVEDTRRFAPKFSRDREGMKAIFDFVDQHILYVEDPRKNQWVQTPSFFWYRRRGDCKSFTVFISSILQNLGIPHFIRYVSYNKNFLLPRSARPYTHVYPVALINGREVPIDVVWKKQERGRFGAEKSYAHKKDFKVEGLYKLGNTGMTAQQYIGQVKTTLNELELALVNVPDDIINAGPGDITQMTKGQLDRYLWEDRYAIYADQEQDPVKAAKYREAAVAVRTGSIAGIGSPKDDALAAQVKRILSKSVQDRQPAFKPFKLVVPNPVQAEMKGFFQDVGDFFKKIGDTFANLFKKFVNWVFKGVGKAMGPYFIFLFANKNRVKSPEIRRRMTEQQKTWDFIRKIGRFDEAQLKGLALNGIKEKTGMSPQEIFQKGATPQIAGAFLVGLVDFVIKAITFVVQVVQKVSNLFKKDKSEGGVIGEGNMSDPTLLEEEAKLQSQSDSGSKTDSSGDSGGGGLALAALAIPFLLKAA